MTCQRCGTESELVRCLLYERTAFTKQIDPPWWSHKTYLCPRCFEVVDPAVNEFIADQLKPKETPQ